MMFQNNIITYNKVYNKLFTDGIRLVIKFDKVMDGIYLLLANRLGHLFINHEGFLVKMF